MDYLGVCKKLSIADSKFKYMNTFKSEGDVIWCEGVDEFGECVGAYFPTIFLKDENKLNAYIVKLLTK